ncbi:MAG: tetratricopeptide repeat protein [Proteobacteria bacterium]|nr:tetratricopeptide repeat protein [Pseudomonadota bacterium]
MKHLHRVLGVTLGLALASLSAHAEDANAKQQEADRLFTEGRELLAKKQPNEACEKFERANQLDPLAAGTKLNLGLCYEELGKYHTAIKWFREALARAAESHLPDHEEAARTHTQMLVLKVPSIAIELAAPVPAELRITIDGEEIKASDYAHVELDPGAHQLVARAPGKRIARQAFELATAANKTISLALIDGDSTLMLDPGKPRRYVAYGAGVVGVGLWVATLVYGLNKKAFYDQEKAEMTPAGNDAANGAARALRRTGTTMFAVGTLAIGGAALLYFTAPDKRAAADTMAWTPTLSTDGVGVAYAGRF